MNDFLKKIDAKTIREAGLFLALISAIFVIYKIVANDIFHLEATVKDHDVSQSEIQRGTNEVLRELSGSIQGNTKVLEAFLRQK